MRASYLLLATLLLAVSVNASSNTVVSLLQSYNVSSATVNGLSSVNMTYGGGTYTELMLGTRPYLLINTTNKDSFSFVFNSAVPYIE